MANRRFSVSAAALPPAIQSPNSSYPCGGPDASPYWWPRAPAPAVIVTLVDPNAGAVPAGTGVVGRLPNIVSNALGNEAPIDPPGGYPATVGLRTIVALARDA